MSEICHLINVLQVLDLNYFVFIIGYIRGFFDQSESVSWEVRSRAGDMTMSIDIDLSLFKYIHAAQDCLNTIEQQRNMDEWEERAGLAWWWVIKSTINHERELNSVLTGSFLWCTSEGHECWIQFTFTAYYCVWKVKYTHLCVIMPILVSIHVTLSVRWK